MFLLVVRRERVDPSGLKASMCVCAVRAVRAVCAGEAKLCGRVRDASSDAGAGCLENILMLRGLLRELKYCCARGFYLVVGLFISSRGLV